MSRQLLVDFFMILFSINVNDVRWNFFDEAVYGIQ